MTPDDIEALLKEARSAHDTVGLALWAMLIIELRELRKTVESLKYSTMPGPG